MESRHSANTGSTGGSATTTITTTEPQPSDRKPKVLRLKLTASADPKVKWSEDTVDNENMGKKSSKSTLFELLFRECLVLNLIYC